jgi:hypothetical protein
MAMADKGVRELVAAQRAVLGEVVLKGEAPVKKS